MRVYNPHSLLRMLFFGHARCLNFHNIEQETYENGDPELLDDSEFYQQLLKEFFETVDPSSTGKISRIDWFSMRKWYERLHSSNFSLIFIC